MQLTRERRSRRTVLRGGVGALLAALAGCTSGTGGSAASPSTGGAADAESTATTTPTGDWRAVELTDVITDETFTVHGFSGRPVLLEFFAVSVYYLVFVFVVVSL